MKQEILDICFCCDGSLYPSLGNSLATSSRHEYVCISNSGGCGFSITLIKNKVAWCKIPINQSTEFRYYNTTPKRKGELYLLSYSSSRTNSVKIEKTLSLKELKEICSEPSVHAERIKKLICLA